MEALCFYYHEHELADIDCFKYGIVNFFDLSYNPEIDYFIKRAGREIPIFKLYKIAGTINLTKEMLPKLFPTKATCCSYKLLG